MICDLVTFPLKKKKIKLGQYVNSVADCSLKLHVLKSDHKMNRHVILTQVEIWLTYIYKSDSIWPFFVFINKSSKLNSPGSISYLIISLNSLKQIEKETGFLKQIGANCFFIFSRKKTILLYQNLFSPLRLLLSSVLPHTLGYSACCLSFFWVISNAIAA